MAAPDQKLVLFREFEYTGCWPIPEIDKEKPSDEFYNPAIGEIEEDVVDDGPYLMDQPLLTKQQLDAGMDNLSESEQAFQRSIDMFGSVFGSDDPESAKHFQLAVDLASNIGRRLYRRIQETKDVHVSFCCLTPTERRLIFEGNDNDEFRTRLCMNTTEWVNACAYASCLHRGFVFGAHAHDSNSELPSAEFSLHVHDMRVLKMHILTSCDICYDIGHKSKIQKKE